MKRVAISIAGALTLVALALPVEALAQVLAGGGDARRSAVVAGIWILKGALLAHAVIALAVFRLGPWGHVARPLVRRSPLGPSTPGPGWTIGIGALLLVGAAFRLYHLDGGLWFDEIQTLVDYVRQPLGYILSTYDSQNNHLLYSLLAKSSVLTFGESGWSVRLPAALLGIMSIWALFAFGRLVTRPREAMLAAILLTVSYHHVWFSQNARGYTGLLLGTLLGTTAFLELVSTERPTWKAILWYGVAMSAAVYIHLTAVLVVAAHAVVWVALVWKRRHESTRAAVRPTLWALFVSGTFSLGLYALVLPQLAGTLFGKASSQSTEWQNPLWLLAESLAGLSQGFPGGPLILVAGFAIVLSGWVSFWRRSPVAAVLMVLPGVLTAAAAILLSHNLWPRLFFFSAGFAVLIAVRGIFAFAQALAPSRGTTIATIVTSAVVLLSVTTVPRAWAPKQDFRAAATLVETSQDPGDAIVTVDLTNYPYRQYLGRAWDSVASIASLQEIERNHTRTWVLYTFPVRLSAVQPEIWNHLQSKYDTAAVFPGTVGGGAVVVMVTR
jgi:hypothetical protein